MHKTGTLSVNMGISQLDGTRLARQNAANPFGAATNFLATRGLSDGDFIWVEGSDGTVGTVPVIFITEAGLAGQALVLMPGAVGVIGKKKSGATKARAKKAGGHRSRVRKSAKRSAAKKR